MSPDPPIGLPAFALVTASSEAVLSGCDEPGEPVFGGGVFRQFIPVGGKEIERISVLLTGRVGGPVEIPARIYSCAPPGKSQAAPPPDRLLKETTLLWNGSGQHWLEWAVNLTPLSGLKIGHYLRLELDLPERIGWVSHRRFEPPFPGALARNDQPDRFENGTFCFRVNPAQPCFWAVNVLPEGSGANRFTGTWKSDPAAAFPQWMDVSWKDPISIEAVELDFPDSPETPVSYQIEISAQNDKPHTLQVDQNDSVRRIHELAPAIAADRVRILFRATRGSSSVSINCLQVRRHRS